MVAAIAIVLVLMTLSAVGGFLAGSALTAFDQFVVDADGAVTFGGGVPGDVPLDTEVVTGDPLAPGQRVTGSLAGRPVEHELVLDRGGSVVIEVVDAEFDSVLVLLDADGEVIESDDDGGHEQWSRIEASLDAGTHHVRVQPWSSYDGAGGTYTLSVD